MEGTIRSLLLKAFKAFVPRDARNSLRLMLALDDRDRPPRQITEFAERRILAIAPHMDDEIAGIGGTLRLHVLAGASVTVVFSTNGCQGCIDPADAVRMSVSERLLAEAACVETRKIESRNACAIIGVTDIRFLDGPDGSFKPADTLVSALSAVIVEVAPEIIYHPSVFDLHEDHWQTTRLLGLCLARGVGAAPSRLRGYEVWTPVPANAVADITDVIECKRGAFASFVSQNTQVEYPRAILGLNAYRSIYAGFGRGYAEAFHETLPNVFQRLLDQTGRQRTTPADR